MTARMDHPQGLAPPQEWWTQQNGHASSEEFRRWLDMEKGREKKRSKFNANRGFREHLGHHVESSLENNTEVLLRFKGYEPWPHKDQDPPPQGKFFRYEGKEFVLTTKRGKVIGYVPDFHLWEDGSYSLWECKGKLDERSKQRLSLMALHHPEIPLELITAPVLERMKAEALYEARRQGRMVLDIPNWEG